MSFAWQPAYLSVEDYDNVEFFQTRPPLFKTDGAHPISLHGCDAVNDWYRHAEPYEAPRDAHELYELPGLDRVLRHSPLLLRYQELGNKLLVPFQLVLYTSGRGLLGTSENSVDARRRLFLFLVGNGFPRSVIVDLVASWVPETRSGPTVRGTRSNRQAISQMLHGFFILLDKGVYYEKSDAHGVYHRGHRYYDLASRTVRRMDEGLQLEEGRRQLREDLDALEALAESEGSVE